MTSLCHVGQAIVFRGLSGGRSKAPTPVAKILLLLAPGLYSLTAELSGFKRYRREGLTLGTGEHPVIDIPLELGDLSQSVTVAANGQEPD